MYIINSSFQKKGDTAKVIKISISFFCLVCNRKISLKLNVSARGKDETRAKNLGLPF